MSSQTATALSDVESPKASYEQVIDEICNLNWAKLNEEDLIRVACSQCNFVSASKLRAKCIPKMNDCCNLIMASATPTIFRPGRASLRLH